MTIIRSYWGGRPRGACWSWTSRPHRAANVRLLHLAAEILHAIELGVLVPDPGWQCKGCAYRSRCWAGGGGEARRRAWPSTRRGPGTCPPSEGRGHDAGDDLHVHAPGGGQEGALPSIGQGRGLAHRHARARAQIGHGGSHVGDGERQVIAAGPAGIRSEERRV